MKKKLLIILLAVFTVNFSNGQGTWTQKTNFGGTSRWGATGFSIGTKAYVGLGFDSTGNKNDFWAWDQTTNSWSAVAAFPGTARYQAVAFSIGNKGYVGTGAEGLNFPFTPHNSDFWEYDPATNQWTAIASCPGTPRFGAVAFSVGNKGYVSTGFDEFTFFLNDLWEYDPAINQWSQKSSLPGINRMEAVGFSIGTKGYVGTGGNYMTGIQLLADFWEYNPANDQWTQKADIGLERSTAVGFSAAGKGYIGLGGDFQSVAYPDFWEYDPLNNQWMQVADFAASARWLSTAFSVGNKGYVTIGGNFLPSHKDLWEFTPSPTGVVNEISADGIILSNYPNPVLGKTTIKYQLQKPATVEIEISDIAGRIVKIIKDGYRSSGTFSTIVDCSQFSNGIFYYTLKTEERTLTNKMIVAK